MKLTDPERKLVAENLSLVERIVTEACRKIPRQVDAEDLYGAALIEFMKRVRSYDPCRGTSFVTWIYRAVRKAALVEAWWFVGWRRCWSASEYDRRDNPVVTNFEDWPQEVLEDKRADRVAFFRDLCRDYLREKLELVREPDRSALRSIYFDGFTRQEAAARIGISARTFNRWVQRGLDVLWEDLAPEEKELTMLIESGPRSDRRDLAAMHRKRSYARDDCRESLRKANKVRLQKSRCRENDR